MPGIQVVNERAPDGGPVLLPDESIILTQPRVACLFAPTDPEIDGTLHVTTGRVVWLPADAAQPGSSMDYQTIAMHAVSRDPGTCSTLPRVPLIFDE